MRHFQGEIEIELNETTRLEGAVFGHDDSPTVEVTGLWLSIEGIASDEVNVLPCLTRRDLDALEARLLEAFWRDPDKYSIDASDIPEDEL